MNAVPQPIIKRRVCREHMCKIYAELKFMERCGPDDMRFNWVEVTAKINPRKDHCGRLLTHNENSQIRDLRYPSTDKRHIAVKLHRHITANGEPGESGRYDPHTIATPEGIKYLPSHPGPCELCEGGDMISPWHRHLFSTYHPGQRAWHRGWNFIRRVQGLIGCLGVHFRAIIKP